MTIIEMNISINCCSSLISKKWEKLYAGINRCDLIKYAFSFFNFPDRGEFELSKPWLTN